MPQSRDYFVNLYHQDQSSFTEAPPARVDWRWGVVTDLCKLRESAARARLEGYQDPRDHSGLRVPVHVERRF